MIYFKLNPSNSFQLCCIKRVFASVALISFWAVSIECYLYIYIIKESIAISVYITCTHTHNHIHSDWIDILVDLFTWPCETLKEIWGIYRGENSGT